MSHCAEFELLGNIPLLMSLAQKQWNTKVEVKETGPYGVGVAPLCCSQTSRPGGLGCWGKSWGEREGCLTFKGRRGKCFH